MPPPPTPAAALLKRARQLAGLTQSQLAERAGVAAPTVSAYETGRRDPTVTSLVRLLDAAGVDLALQESETARRGRRLEEVLGLASVLPRPSRDEKPDLPSWKDLVRPGA